MKTKQKAATAAALIAIGVFASLSAKAQTTSPSIPVGSLTAFPTVVQTGTKPTLTWNISYPAVVQDYVTVTTTPGAVAPGTVTPKENLVCKVRMLGLGVTSQGSNGAITYYRTRTQIRYNGATAWETVYDGKQTDTAVQQQQIVKTYNMTSAKAIDFAGQYYNNGWYTLFSSLSGDNVRTLVNGSTPPPYMPAYNAPSLESFLKPYLDASGKVKIGPMDVIVFMELTHTDKKNTGYDFQDAVMLLTFSQP